MLSTKKNVKPAKRERHRKVAEAFLSEVSFLFDWPREQYTPGYAVEPRERRLILAKISFWTQDRCDRYRTYYYRFLYHRYKRYNRRDRIEGYLSD